jgi:anti-anti-sigma regulatory factor
LILNGLVAPVTVLVCVLEARLPVALVRLTGHLNLATSPQLRTALHRALTEQPSGIVVDLAGLTLDDDLALTVFTGFAGTAAELAGCPVALCAPSARLGAALEQFAINRTVPVHPTRRAAVAAVQAAPAARRYRRRLPTAPAAPRLARRVLVEACRDWQVPGVVDDAEVVVTELVSNAVRHAGGELQLNVALGLRFLHLALRDGSPVPPTRLIPDPYLGGGRGLILIDALAAGWGSTPTPGGKVVWATLPLD